MSAAAVHELVEQVKDLPEDDRQLFDELLVRLEEEEWKREAGKARRLARERGIDQGPARDLRRLRLNQFGSLPPATKKNGLDHAAPPSRWTTRT